MAGAIKKTTGLAGLVVAENAHGKLSHLYKRLKKVLALMPDESVYKKSTMAIIDSRQKVIESTDVIDKIEKEIGAGQIEELIHQAENEIILARSLNSYRPWEPLVEQAPKNQWKWPI